MPHVEPMAFSMRFSSSRLLDRARAAVWLAIAGLRRQFCWLLLLVIPWVAVAQAPADVQVLREPEGLYLSARLPLDVPPGLEDVLLRGVPLHFVWQADVRRSRWYWTDQRVATFYRVVRVAYQPLTRRWRVSVGSSLSSDLGQAGALHQNLDSFDQAIAAVLSVARWRLVSGEDLPDADGLRVELQFRMDGGLLPRPFQLGNANAVDWGMTYRQTLPVLAPELPKDPS